MIMESMASLKKVTIKKEKFGEMHDAREKLRKEFSRGSTSAFPTCVLSVEYGTMEVKQRAKRITKTNLARDGFEFM